jgi:7-cyano-7-deazaguanine synthase
MNAATVVLLSGGLDSSATLALYRTKSVDVSALFVEYGQPAVAQERDASQRIAAHYETRLITVRCAGLREVGAGYIRGRNALLLQMALATAQFDVGQIAIGLHSGTPYVDCSPAFLAEAQRMFDLYCDGRIRVVAPFIKDDKRGVVDFCREVKVPLGMTYSCERGGERPCGSCSSCGDRTALHVD